MYQQLVQQTRDVISSSFSSAKKSLEAMSFSQILKTCKVPQCRLMLSNNIGGDNEPDHFCAMGAVMNKLGWNGKQGRGNNWTPTDSKIIWDQLGINAMDQYKIAGMNDVQKLDFDTIALAMEMEHK